MTDAPRAPGAASAAYLGIGSNLGDRVAHLQGAVDGLAAAEAVDVVAVSPVYETAPVGGPEQPDYLNAVVAVDTTLAPRELLVLANRLEAEADRVREVRWGPRTLDVDVLLVGDEEVNEPDLVVPAPADDGAGVRARAPGRPRPRSGPGGSPPSMQRCDPPG